MATWSISAVWRAAPSRLSMGAIPIYADSLSIQGRSAADTIISGNGTDRVFIDYGYTALVLNDVTVRDGFNEVSGYTIAGGACIAIQCDRHARSRRPSPIARRSARARTAAAFSRRDCTMYTSAISDNTAKGALLKTLTASYGGGAFAYRGTAAIFDSTITNNRAIRRSSRNRIGTLRHRRGIVRRQRRFISCARQSVEQLHGWHRRRHRHAWMR